MRIGGFKLLALAVFAAGFMGLPPIVHAQEDANPPVYVTPNSNSTAKPLFLRKLFGTEEPNSGVGTPKPYDFSHRNDQPEKHGFDQEANDAFYRDLEVYTSAARALFDVRHKEQVALAEQDRQRSYAFLASLRKTAATTPQVPHPGAGNFVHHGSKREHKVRNTTHAHSNNVQSGSGEAPPIYVQH
ncbi:MAG TPA: hypothetical protein VL625_10295 [Patescibacteria group bacterium]|nr:hypothetical protein [Patescibacteria group bacterium]